jgi:AAHS family 4-hydroxybenzoate transporter-like MFS transporter
MVMAVAMETRDSVDLGALMDEAGSFRFQLRLLLLLGCFMFVEGYDMQVLAYAAPAMIKTMHVSKAAFGVVFGGAMAGVMIGALLLGTLGDTYGRKLLVIGGLSLFGIFNFMTIAAPDMTMLMVLRTIAGIGLGGAVPNAIALMVDYAPTRRRAVAVCLLYIGYNIGAALGGVIAARMIPAWGWQSVFVLGGIMPLGLAAVLALVLPESVRFLSLRGRQAAARALLARMRPDLALGPDTRILVTEEARQGVPVRHLFTEGRALMSALLRLGAIGTIMTEHFMTSWLPMVLTAGGIGLAKAVTASAVMLTVGTFGSIAIGFAIERFGIVALAVLVVLGVPSVVALGHVGGDEGLLMVLAGAAGFFLIGGLTGMNILASTIYPTYMRSTGAGWANAMSRIGAIVGPVLGGVLLSFDLSLQAIFATAAIPAAIGALAIFVLSRLRVANEQRAVRAVQGTSRLQAQG